MFDIMILSIIPPSTSSKARPLQLRKVQLVTTQLRKPPFDSVPNLMRPLLQPARCGIMVPSNSVPSLKPDTWQFVIVMFSVINGRLSAYELFGQMASSLGQLTRELDIVVLVQQS